MISIIPYDESWWRDWRRWW